MIQLSAVVITQNEAKNIGRCLDSLQALCEDIVVVDAFSEDETPAICKERGVHFVQRPFDTFHQQKKAALSLTLHEHVLTLDADECLSEELRSSILSVKQQGFRCTGYKMRRLSFYKQRAVRSCGWYPNFQLRLFKKSKGTWSNNLLHEHIVLADGSSCGLLRGDLLHYTYQTPAQMQKKVLHYSDLYAKEHRFRRRIGPLGVALKAFFAFWRPYLLQGGFMDGYVGLLISRSLSEGTFYKYFKLMEANRALRSTLIITTYNRPDALKEVLDSVRRQSLLPAEVIIADDGSTEATRHLISAEKTNFPVPLRHCWQEDKGFRLESSSTTKHSQPQQMSISVL